MITRDSAAFLEFARTLDPDFGPATARAAFLVSPDGFVRTDESAEDNRYMAEADAYDPARAARQHRELHRALTAVIPTITFAGDPDAPDAVFPNNVFATAAGRYVVGRMHHPVRRVEAGRTDIREFFGGVLGYEEVDLSTQPHACELTGALVVDRARGIGFVGLSERCDEEGARLMHEALGLRATLMFDLAPEEYHTNVVLAVLAGRAVVIGPQAFADPAVVDAIASLYAPHTIVLEPEEHLAFVGNSISLSETQVWMSAGADAALTDQHRADLADAGFRVESVELDGIEGAGGS
ncbi:MAG TPA: arginine deiminase-related protein, partial [Homoserinimonas sp.]|nr:arginine deiminase-related protein [Homoserinimonas sp.]